MSKISRRRMCRRLCTTSGRPRKQAPKQTCAHVPTDIEDLQQLEADIKEEWVELVAESTICYVTMSGGDKGSGCI